VAALARVAAVAEGLAGVTPFEEAAELALAIVRERPFDGGANGAVAWLAISVVLDAARVRVRARAADVVAFVRGLDEASSVLEVTAAIERLAAVAARRPTWRCPACHRELYAAERRAGRAIFVGVTDFELTNRCWYEHRAHDRRGEPFPALEPIGAV
jgi:hypothetical protein